MSYSAQTFVADEQPTTAKWNKLWSNDASFNDGTGIADDAIIQRHILASAIGAAERKEVIKVGAFALSGSNGAQAITGVGFQPKAVIFFGSMDSSHQSAAVANFQIGFSDGTTTRGFGMRSQEGGDTSAVVSTANAGWIPSTGAAVASSFVLTSRDADGFTITVSASAGSTASVAYIAIA